MLSLVYLHLRPLSCPLSPPYLFTFHSTTGDLKVILSPISEISSTSLQHGLYLSIILKYSIHVSYNKTSLGRLYIFTNNHCCSTKFQAGCDYGRLPDIVLENYGKFPNMGIWNLARYWMRQMINFFNPSDSGLWTPSLSVCYIGSAHHTTNLSNLSIVGLVES